ncbi:MAG: hypothetical protein JSR99_08430 [Proteobacteria bacterium]|nr:hypothetical protein [Pseudomonadota bacterium]
MKNQADCGKSVPRLGVASLSALLLLTGIAHAEDCIDVQSTAAAADFKPCDEFEPQLDLNAALAERAQSADAQATDSVPWIATDTSDLPATFSTSDSGVSVRTSLGTWRDYNAKSASATVAQPEFGSAVNSFDLPKAPVAAKTPIDVWSNLDVNGFDGSRDQSTRAGVGADYTLNKAAVVGVSVEHGDARSALVPGIEQDQKASAYMTLQATPLLSLDARTEWQSGNAEFAEASGAAERGAFLLAPKLNKSFQLDDGTTLSPFLTYQREFDLSASHRDGVDPTLDAMQSAGAGITYSKPDSYSLSVTADVDNFGGAEDQKSLSSRFQLSVPLSK